MFNVLHSSAGAGKTHALVKHYLVLSLGSDDPAAYTRILALTFTNKAAGEMRERVLEYLEGLGGASPLSGALSDVAETVRAEAGVTEKQLRERAQRTLSHMLHHWPQLAVSTIDAFTRRVVMPFARDLRLDHDLRMTTEEEYYRSKAVDLLLEEAGNDHALTDLLVATCEQLLEEERSWRPDKPLLDLSKQLSKEDAIQHLATLRALGSAQFIAMHKRLRERVHTFRETMREHGRRAWKAVQEADLTEKDLAYGKAGPFGYVKNLMQFDAWQSENKNVLRVLSSDKWTSASASASTKSAVDSIAPLLRDTISYVEDTRETTMRDHAIAAAVLRELMPTATLTALEQRLEQLKQEDGVAFFSDLTRKVAAIVQEEPAPFLYERLGERYQHFLIDEFQDTSLLQWHALLPLLENALGSGGSALLVGDAKQAIYRWRNGEVRQFIQLPELFAKERLTLGEEREATLIRNFVERPRLAHNHRSAHGIIGFNNALIAALKEHLNDDDRAVYHLHEQAATKPNAGLITISCFAEEEEEKAPPAVAFVLRSVAEAVADGFRAGDIAVLVRTKAQGRTIAEHLVANSWNVVSPDGLSLGGDVGVNTVIALLGWLQRPDDERAAHAAQYMALLAATSAVTDPFSTHHRPKDVLRTWSIEHPMVSTRSPLVPLLCRIIDALQLDPATDAFVMGLINEAYAFTKDHGDDISAFMEHWERTARNRSIGGANSVDAVRIMTVHASKGLQFPVVIVPHVGKRSMGQGRDLIWIHPDAHVEGPPSALVQMKLPLTAMGIPELEEEARLRALDDMDLLYVAFTRPEQRLYAGVDGKSNDPLAKGMREHLGLAAGDTRMIGERGTAIIKETKADRSITLHPSSPIGRRTLAIRREAPEEWDPADPDPYRARGSALHAILARVNTAEDLPAAMWKEGPVWGIDPAEQAVILEQLRALLSAPLLQPFFKEGLKVYTERTLITQQGVVLRPDRVVREGDEVRVLDIKTGARSEHHKEQVRGYAGLLHQLEEVTVTAALLYINEGVLVPVDA